MVVQDSRMVFVPFMAGHKARLPKLMSSLVKKPDRQGAVTLSVTAAAAGVGEVLRRMRVLIGLFQDEEDLTVPPVKYFLG